MVDVMGPVGRWDRVILVFMVGERRGGRRGGGDDGGDDAVDVGE